MINAYKDKLCWIMIYSGVLNFLKRGEVEMFKRIVVVDNVGLNDWAKNKLQELGEQVDCYDDFPKENREIIRRIGDADCVMVSYNTLIQREVIEECKNIKYIGMCCTLYNEKSANVDIAAAKEHGITVLGINDYGNEGIVEYVVSELVRLLHGFGKHQWKNTTNEITDQKIGILGLGRTGLMVANALKFFGADMYYNDRIRREDAENQGIKYLPFDHLLQQVDILSTHLPKNAIALHKREFELYGNSKILINTSIGPTFSVPALKSWLENKDNYYLCEEVGMGSYFDELGSLENVIYVNKPAGRSEQCTKRQSEKSIDNVYSFLKNLQK